MKAALDPRSVIGIASFVLVIIVLVLIKFDKTLLESDAFLILATALVITGWVNGPVSWAYSATKTGGELADANAKIVVDQASTPRKVEVDQPANKPIPTTDSPAVPAGDKFAWEKDQ